MITPKRYRERPVEVEAVQLDLQNAFDVLDEVGGELEMTDYGTPTALLVPFCGAIVRVQMGDYIIRGGKGEFYPWERETFENTYEEVTQ